MVIHLVAVVIHSDFPSGVPCCFPGTLKFQLKGRFEKVAHPMAGQGPDRTGALPGLPGLPGPALAFQRKWWIQCVPVTFDTWLCRLSKDTGGAQDPKPPKHLLPHPKLVFPVRSKHQISTAVVHIIQIGRYAWGPEC